MNYVAQKLTSAEDRSNDLLQDALSRIPSGGASGAENEGEIQTQISGFLNAEFANPSFIVTACIIASFALLFLVLTGRLSWTSMFFRSGETQRQVAAVMPLGGPIPTTMSQEAVTIKKGEEQASDISEEAEEEEDNSYSTAPTWEGIIDLGIFQEASSDTNNPQPSS